MENTLILLTLAALLSFTACQGDREHVAGAVSDNDSLLFMTAHGVSNLISDSGVVRYRIVAEDWTIYNAPPGGQDKWVFDHGFFIQRFGEFYAQSDTAYCHGGRLWELRGRVVIRNTQNTVFRSEEFFWDMQQHEIYSNLYVSIVEPQRNLNGYRFRSNEDMTRYIIYNSDGYLPADDMNTQPQTNDSANPD